MCRIGQTGERSLDRLGLIIKETDLKEPPSHPRCERCDLQLTPLVVQSSDFRWATAPHLRQVPDQTSRPDRTDAVRPVVAPKDDIVGWPDELLIDFPDFPDCTLDTVANTPTPDSARHPCLSKTTKGEPSLLAVIDRGSKCTRLPFQS